MRQILAAVTLIVGCWWEPAAFAQVPPGGGGGSGGDVTCSSVPCATATNQTKVQSAPGTPQTTAVTIQGNAGAIPIPVSGTFSATLGGFTPSASGAKMTQLAVTTSDSSGTLPTGAVVVVSNTGSNPMFCNVNAITATTSDQLIPGSSWFAFTIPATITTLHCISTGGATTADGLGGSGLPTGAGGGSASSGLLQTATTTAAPTYSTGTNNPVSTDTAGNTRTVDSTVNTSVLAGQCTQPCPVAQLGDQNQYDATGTPQNAALTGTLVLVTGSAANFMSIECRVLATGAGAWVVLWDAATTGAVTKGTTAAKKTIYCPPGNGTAYGQFDHEYNGVKFTAGIVAGSFTDTTAGSTATTLTSIGWKAGN